jgi:dipeptidyl aminopeptidase/acylaminoacyl peptidase
MTATELHDALIGLAYPTSVCLSPDGRRLAYVGVPGDRALRLLDTGTGAQVGAAGGTQAEVSSTCWSTDGALLWTVDRDESDEPTRLSVLDAVGRPIASTTVPGAIEDVVATAADAVLLRVADPGSDRDGMNLGLRVDGAPTDPAVRTSAAPPLRRLVRAVVVSGIDGSRVETSTVDLDGWTAWDVGVRGDRAVVVASRETRPAGYYRPSLLLVDLAAEPTGVRRLLDTEGQLARPRVAPSGDRALVVEGQSIVSGVVHLVDLASGARETVPGLDDVTDLDWIDEHTAWFAGWDDLGVQVGRISFTTTPPTVTRWTGTATIHGAGAQPSLAVAPDGETAYAVWDAPGHPPEIVSLRFDAPGTTPLTAHNAALAARAGDVATEQLSWRSPDGTEVHGLLMAPANRPGPLPLVVLLHGGPTWLWSASFAPAESNHLALPLAAAGAAVLMPNPRGSSGRGQAYARLVNGDLGGGDLADVLAGVALLGDRGIADPTRAAVMGLSYGGYLAALAAVVGGGFRAAVVMSGVTDWLGFASTSVIGGGGYDACYHPAGTLKTAAGREALVTRSPLYLAHAGATPTLFLHGAGDRVTPVAQAEQLFGVLSRAGVPTELVTYPREGHELVEPAHRRDAAARVLRWLHAHGVLDQSLDREE